jgi:hypothetical protein
VSWAALGGALPATSHAQQTGTGWPPLLREVCDFGAAAAAASGREWIARLDTPELGSLANHALFRRRAARIVVLARGASSSRCSISALIDQKRTVFSSSAYTGLRSSSCPGRNGSGRGTSACAAVTGLVFPVLSARSLVIPLGRADSVEVERRLTIAETDATSLTT